MPASASSSTPRSTTAHRFAKDAAGELVYWAGSVAIHALEVSFARRIAADAERYLPYHASAKKIPFVDADGAVVKPDAPERSQARALPLRCAAGAQRVAILEVARADEYAPLKNAEGNDSVATASASARRDRAALARDRRRRESERPVGRTRSFEGGLRRGRARARAARRGCGPRARAEDDLMAIFRKSSAKSVGAKKSTSASKKSATPKKAPPTKKAAASKTAAKPKAKPPPPTKVVAKRRPRPPRRRPRARNCRRSRRGRSDRDAPSWSRPAPRSRRSSARSGAASSAAPSSTT
jgi:hypothetical protein